MKLNRFLPLALLACVSALASSSASAALVTWDLNPGNLNGNVGSASQVYTVSGHSITAFGYDKASSGSDVTHQLFFKSGGPIGGGSEHGLGLVGTLDNELQVNANGTPANYIQLDLRSILSQGFTGGQIEVGSIQTGESFRLFGSNAQGTLGTQLTGTWGSIFDEQFVSIPNFGSFQFISIASNAADVLPIAFRASITPVPEMNALFPLVGLIAAVGSTHLLRRRRMARVAATITTR
ncbi:MAG: hypothetical protein M3119_06170 [Verrucomicrobiota bacterium]|nr:hypothetical protein [Verrucomicrobiota bacterium]